MHQYLFHTHAIVFDPKVDVDQPALVWKGVTGLVLPREWVGVGGMRSVTLQAIAMEPRRAR